MLISLYVDDKKPLPEPVEVTENGQKRTLRTIGRQVELSANVASSGLTLSPSMWLSTTQENRWLGRIVTTRTSRITWIS